jgi:hypothetical protein
MKTVRLVCPNCSSPEFEALPMDASRCRCRHCGNYFAITEAVSHRGPATAGAPQRGKVASAGMGVVVFAFVATFLVLSGAAVFLMIGRRAAREPGRTYTYEPPSRRRVEVAQPPVTSTEVASVPVEAEKAPQAEVRNVRHGEQSGYEVWVLEIANTGEVPIDHPCARAVLKDAQGAVLRDERGYAQRDVIGAGQTAPLRITAKKSSYARVDVELCDLRALTWALREIPVKVAEHKLQRGDFGSNAVIGTVENTGGEPLKFVKIVVMGRDEQGQMVSVDETYADTQVLKPGAKSSFKVHVGIFQVGTVARYDAFAVGRPSN